MTATIATRAWSSTMRLVVADPRVLEAAGADFLTTLRVVDATASRFRADSPLSVANARAGRPTPVPHLLVELVGAALEAARRTGGLVDPTIGVALHRIGYDRDLADVLADPGPIGDSGPDRAPAVAGPGARTWQDVRLDRSTGLLTVPAGTSLDLGATAKAWVADRLATTLSRRYATPVLVELGGDVALGGEQPGGWELQVAERAGGSGQRVVLQRGGMATSTTTVRRWHRNGTLVHHLVDPRTGTPANGPWRTVTVVAHTAYDANVASTAAIVLGEPAVDWLAHRRLSARLVAQDGSVRHTAGWPVPLAEAVAS